MYLKLAWAKSCIIQNRIKYFTNKIFPIPMVLNLQNYDPIVKLPLFVLF